MRILAVSNLYPPHYIGGYELGCQRVMDELRRRGHETAVLTTTYGVDQPTTEGPVHRLLGAHAWSPSIPLFAKRRDIDGLWALGRAQRADSRTLRRLAARFRPDVVTIWGTLGLSSSLLNTLYFLNIPKVYAISDIWLSDYVLQNPERWIEFWQRPARSVWKRGLKYLLRSMVSYFVSTNVPPVDWQNAFFTSKKLRQLYADGGLPAGNAGVIYWGVSAEYFRGDRGACDSGNPAGLRLLYAGQLVEHKGVHTLLEALPLLGSSAMPIRVSIAGRIKPEEPYDRRLQSVAAAVNGCCSVDFLGHIASQEMPRVLQAHDVLVFPSIYEEPFSIVVLEAMAAGLCVVGTTTGGSAEILKEGVNSLTFQAGNAQALATQLKRLIDDPSLRRRLARVGQHQVKEHFSLSAKVDELEALLRKVCSVTVR